MELCSIDFTTHNGTVSECHQSQTFYRTQSTHVTNLLTTWLTTFWNWCYDLVVMQTMYYADLLNQTYQTKPTKPYQPNPIYQTRTTKPNLPNQTYQTQPTKPNLLNQTYQTKPTKPNLLNQTYQTKLTKPNLPNQTCLSKPNLANHA